MFESVLVCVLLCYSIRGQVIPSKTRTVDGDYNNVDVDGSFEFGYANSDRGASYHVARGNAARTVGGRFGARDPASGLVRETVYTAGPRGFRAKGPNIHRKMDLDQRPRGPIGNREDPNFDPNEDPSYSFQQKTSTYSKSEAADSRGDVKGHYSFVDDVGERHDVSYVAGRDTGFLVTSAHPDNANSLPPHFYRAPLVRGEARARGKSSVQRGLDGSYRFVSAGPDQRRTESSDSRGNVRGSYSFLDDKGVQRTVHYIAGPGIGYRIVKSGKDPYIPSYFPTIPTAYDPDFVVASSGGPDLTADKYPDSREDIFKSPDGSSASGHVKPPPFSNGGKGDKPKPGFANTDVEDEYGPEYVSSSVKPPTAEAGKPIRRRPYRPTRPTSSPKPFHPSASSAPQPNSNEIGFDSASKDDKGYKYDPPKGYKPGNDKGSDGYNPKGPSFGKDEHKGPDFGIGYNVDHSDPGSTIIRNVGEDYFSVPPGVAVRAHVQSIDLYPYGSKRLTPGEAIDKVQS